MYDYVTESAHRMRTKMLKEGDFTEERPELLLTHMLCSDLLHLSLVSHYRMHIMYYNPYAIMLTATLRLLHLALYTTPKAPAPTSFISFNSLYAIWYALLHRI